MCQGLFGSLSEQQV